MIIILIYSKVPPTQIFSRPFGRKLINYLFNLLLNTSNSDFRLTRSEENRLIVTSIDS